MSKKAYCDLCGKEITPHNSLPFGVIFPLDIEFKIQHIPNERIQDICSLCTTKKLRKIGNSPHENT